MVEDLTPVANERRESKVQLEDEYANGPPIHAFVVLAILAVQDLGRHVLWSADVLTRALTRTQDGRKAEIDELNVAVLADDDVLTFQVSMNDVLAMEVAQRDNYLSDVELHQVLREPSVSLEQSIKLSSS